MMYNKQLTLCSEPENENQRLALLYRKKEESPLSTAADSIGRRMNAAHCFSTFCQHDRHLAADSSGTNYLADMHLHVEMLPLECAFEWLRIHYPELFTAVVQMISDDQEEPLPINWAVLVEDWDHSYWIVWIFTVWMLWAQNGEAFRLRHTSLSSWLLEMNRYVASPSFMPKPCQMRD
jgi:histone-lysine N-methyltransferase SETD3